MSFWDVLTLFLLLSGAVGGGMSITRVLEHFGVNSDVCILVAGLYWILYCVLVISRVRTKSDVQRTSDARLQRRLSGWTRSRIPNLLRSR